MANEVLGECVCPVCKSEHPQQVRISEKSGKPYLNCDECGCQIFARQPASVKILRGMVAPGQKPDNMSVPEKQPEAAPVLAGQVVAKLPEKSPPQPAPVLAGQKEPAPPLMAQPEEKTIFDIFN